MATRYDIHDDNGESSADSLSDAISQAEPLADIFAIQYSPSMPAADEKTMHHWRIGEGRKVTKIF